MTQASAGGAAHNAMVVTKDGPAEKDADEPPETAPADIAADEADEGSSSDGVDR